MEYITAGATLVLAAAAWYSAWQSRKSVKAIQESRYDEFRPFLTPQEGSNKRRQNGEKVQIEFRISNNGEGPLFSLDLLNEGLDPHMKKTLDSEGDSHVVVLKDPDEKNFDRELVFQYQDIYSRKFQTISETKFQDGKVTGVSGNFRQIEISE